MNSELAQYEVGPEPMWDRLAIFGDGGYGAIEQAEKRQWHAIPAWGEKGWDLGNWPYVIVFWRTTLDTSTYEVAEYVERDVTCYKCPTPELRDQITDSIAFFHWKHMGEDFVAAYASETDAPPALRGPYSHARSQTT